MSQQENDKKGKINLNASEYIPKNNQSNYYQDQNYYSQNTSEYYDQNSLYSQMKKKTPSNNQTTNYNSNFNSDDTYYKNSTAKSNYNSNPNNNNFQGKNFNNQNYQPKNYDQNYKPAFNNNQYDQNYKPAFNNNQYDQNYKPAFNNNQYDQNYKPAFNNNQYDQNYNPVLNNNNNYEQNSKPSFNNNNYEQNSKPVFNNNNNNYITQNKSQSQSVYQINDQTNIKVDVPKRTFERKFGETSTSTNSSTPSQPSYQAKKQEKCKVKRIFLVDYMISFKDWKSCKLTTNFSEELRLHLEEQKIQETVKFSVNSDSLAANLVKEIKSNETKKNVPHKSEKNIESVPDKIDLSSEKNEDFYMEIIQKLSGENELSKLNEFCKGDKLKSSIFYKILIVQLTENKELIKKIVEVLLNYKEQNLKVFNFDYDLIENLKSFILKEKTELESFTKGLNTVESEKRISVLKKNCCFLLGELICNELIQVKDIISLMSKVIKGTVSEVSLKENYIIITHSLFSYVERISEENSKKLSLNLIVSSYLDYISEDISTITLSEDVKSLYSYLNEKIKTNNLDLKENLLISIKEDFKEKGIQDGFIKYRLDSFLLVSTSKYLECIKLVIDSLIKIVKIDDKAFLINYVQHVYHFLLENTIIINEKDKLIQFILDSIANLSLDPAGEQSFYFVWGCFLNLLYSQGLFFWKAMDRIKNQTLTQFGYLFEMISSAVIDFPMNESLKIETILTEIRKLYIVKFNDKIFNQIWTKHLENK